MSRAALVFGIGAALLCAAMVAHAAPTAAGVQGPRLGTPVSAAELARLDITVTPDGTGLPGGTGSVAEGARVYAQRCQSCHGAAGVGGVGAIPRLTGGVGSLATDKPVKTVNSFWPYAPIVFDYVRRSMPPTAPQSLTAPELYAVTAYILSLDGIVPADARLDARTLAAVGMPNRDGFVRKWPLARSRPAKAARAR